MMRIPDRDDRGFSLVELLIYTVLLGAVLAAGFGLLLNSFRGSQLVTGAAEATRDAQSAARTIAAGVRNATHVSLSGSLVVAGSLHGTQLRCTGWYLAGTNLYARLSNSAITTATFPAGWTLIAAGVRPVDATTPVFAVVDKGLSVRFTVDTATDDPALVDTYSVPRLAKDGLNPCL